VRTVLLAALLLPALLLPAAAAAQRGVGVEAGLRLAWAHALGSAASHVPMSETAEWQVPIQADVLWSADRFAAGIYGSWGPGGLSGPECSEGASCSARDVRAGVQLYWRFPPAYLGAMPWLGGALGWEWASHRRERLGVATTTRWNGPELAAQGGAEWRVWRQVGVGPFLLLGLGRYERMTVETSQEQASEDVARHAVHAWIHVGVRGTYAF
jgi:hypothetical protein